MSVKIFNGCTIKGMRFTDEQGNHMIDLQWSSVGVWQKHDIPSGQEIIGLKCNKTGVANAIPMIGLKTWLPRFNQVNEDQTRKAW